MNKSAVRWTLGAVAALLVAGIVSGGVQELANAQPQNPQAETQKKQQGQVASLPEQQSGQKPAWSSHCSSVTRKTAPECVVEQTAFLTKTGQRLATVKVRLPSSGGQPVMMIQVPVGLYLPAGLSMKIDERKPIALQIQTCDLQGCYAGSPISPDLLNAMKSGKRLSITFQDINKRNIAVPLTLERFAEVYRTIQ